MREPSSCPCCFTTCSRRRHHADHVKHELWCKVPPAAIRGKAGWYQLSKYKSMIPSVTLQAVTVVTLLRIGLSAPQRTDGVRVPLYEDMAPWSIETMAHEALSRSLSPAILVHDLQQGAGVQG